MMKRNKLILMLCVFLIGTIGWGIHIVTTINPYYLIMSELAGDMVDVQLLIKQGQNPHIYSPTIQDVRTLNQADWIIANGYGLESFLSNTLEDLARQGKKVTFAGELIPAAKLVGEVDHHDHDCAHHDDHGPINPHVWVEPVFMAEYVVPGLAKELAWMLPESASLIFERAKKMVHELEAFNDRAHHYFDGYRNSTIVMSHPSFTYFFRRFGIAEAAIFSGEATEPTIEDIRRIIQTIREEKVLAIFGELHISPRSLDVIVQETGLKTPLRLNTLGWGTHTIAELYESNFQTMKQQIQ